MELSGTTGLVLGASRGIGLALARSLARKGARLALPWHDWPEDSGAMIKEFGNPRDRHLSLETDLRQPDDITRLSTAIDKRFGKLDFLINNIERGGMPIIHGSYHRAINQDQWQLELDTTLHAKWLVFEACLPLLRRSNDAAVVNLSSIAGLTGRTGPAGLLFSDGYAAANRAISSLTATWARTGAPTIRVNEVMLGFIDTRHGPGTRGWQNLSTDEQQNLLAHTLLERTGTPEEVVQTVTFLLEQADYITGAVIRLDGGYLLGGEKVPSLPNGVL